MADAHTVAAEHAAHGHYPGFFTRWFASTNHEDIGTLYLVFAISAGILGGALSVLMRAQLMTPNGEVLANHQLYNVIITAHGLIMVFFMVMPAMIGGLGKCVVSPVISWPATALPGVKNTGVRPLATSFIPLP